MKELITYNRAAGYLNRIFDLLNEEFFESTLSRPTITIQSTPKAYGHFSLRDDTWISKKGATHEINLGAGTLARPIEEVCATLLHEMVHYHCYVNGIQDCSRGGTYHNRRFRDSAEAHGLIVAHHDKYGWTITSPSDALLQFCLDNDLSDILINRNEYGGYRVTSSDTRKRALQKDAFSGVISWVQKSGGNSMIYGYARVSTAGQSKDGNSLEDQTRALKACGCQEIVTEAFTGKSMERPAFSALFQKLQEGDTLVVTKLDRFARTAIDGVSAVRELFIRGVRVHILNMGLIENTLTGNLILTVMLAFAEYERGMIVERTQNGKAVARQDPNFREGRPKKYTATQIRHAMELLDSGRSYKQVEAMTGISKSTLIRAKTKM